MMNGPLEIVEKYKKIWEEQGRSEEEKWAVTNFLTGAGIQTVKEIYELGQAEKLREIEDWAKHDTAVVKAFLSKKVEEDDLSDRLLGYLSGRMAFARDLSIFLSSKNLDA